MMRAQLWANGRAMNNGKFHVKILRSTYQYKVQSIWHKIEYRMSNWHFQIKRNDARVLFSLVSLISNMQI